MYKPANYEIKNMKNLIYTDKEFHFAFALHYPILILAMGSLFLICYIPKMISRQ